MSILMRKRDGSQKANSWTYRVPTSSIANGEEVVAILDHCD